MASLLGVTAAALLLAAGAAAADPAHGLWRVEGGDAVVEIAPCGDSVCGRIVWMAEPNLASGEPKRDQRNEDPARRDRPVCGMQMIGGFEQDGPGEWENGEIYNPRNGKTYSADMAVRGETLRLRGYVGVPLFGETQVWTREAAAPGAC
jgi:uncharacterized protein (DUF2147 family)